MKKLSLLRRKRLRLAREAAELIETILQGTWLERQTQCGNKNCRCHQGEPHGPHFYLSITIDKKSRHRYIPLSEVKTARQYVRTWSRLQRILHEISDINLSLVRQKALSISDPHKTGRKH